MTCLEPLPRAPGGGTRRRRHGVVPRFWSLTIAAVFDVPPIEKLSRVPLRQMWRHEALDFTRWLEENLDVLNDHLDVPLVSADRERSTGSFNVDLLGEDESGRTVVIENQLEGPITTTLAN